MPERAGGDLCARGKQYGEEQNIRIVKEEQSNNAVALVCRAHGMMETTGYQWRTRFSAMDKPELQHLNELEDENRRLKALAADLVTEIQVLEKLNLKRWQRGRR
ncbi:MAG: transposase [Candidatus Hydrogenedentota bacterium]